MSTHSRIRLVTCPPVAGRSDSALWPVRCACDRNKRKGPWHMRKRRWHAMPGMAMWCFLASCYIRAVWIAITAKLIFF